MKNIGSILALAAFCTGIVSARALPAGDSIIVRAPYPISKNLARIMTFLTTIDVARYPADDPKKLKNAAGKAGKAGKGGKAGNAGNAGTDYVEEQLLS